MSYLFEKGNYKSLVNSDVSLKTGVTLYLLGHQHAGKIYLAAMVNQIDILTKTFMRLTEILLLNHTSI